MEKTIELDNKKVRVRSTAATAIIYRNQFNVDFFADMMKLATTIPQKKTALTTKDMSKIDLLPFYRFLWAIAKTADSSIPAMIDWLDQFESIDISTVLPEVQDIMVSSVQGKKH